MDDFELAIQELKSQHVPIHIEPFETSVCHMAVIADPDGNGLIIHKYKRKS